MEIFIDKVTFLPHTNIQTFMRLTSTAAFFIHLQSMPFLSFLFSVNIKSENLWTRKLAFFNPWWWGACEQRFRPSSLTTCPASNDYPDLHLQFFLSSPSPPRTSISNLVEERPFSPPELWEDNTTGFYATCKLRDKKETQWN